MFTGQRFTWLLVVFLFVALLLAACERPLNREDDDSETQEPLPTVVIIESETVNEEIQDESDESSGEAEEPKAEVEEPAEESTEVEPDAEPTEVVSEPEPTPEEEVEESDEDTEATEEEEVAEEESTEDEDTEEADSDDADETTDNEAESDTDDAEDSDQEEEDQSDTSTETDVSGTLPVTHTVAAGENLYRISLLYDIPLATMAAFNNIINVDQVYVGQVLQIPGGTESETAEPDEPEVPAEPEKPTEPDEPPAEGTLYTVQLGDTLSQIGFLFGISWIEIAEANGIVTPNQIYAGQILKIPTSAPGPNPQFAHTVLPGQTLHTISLQYGVAWLTIATANQLGSPYVIYPGQTLVIPGA